jgi:small nuclear ribonucleoprotein (snRNP)-like protein
MLDDLEMQAEGLHLADRAVEVDALSVAEYAEVELVARLHASRGTRIRIGTRDEMDLHGRLASVGSDWILVQDEQACAWFVHLTEVVVIRGLVSRSVPAQARPLAARLSLNAVLRRLAEERLRCVLHLRGGRTVHGVLVRVGADFVELRRDETDDRMVVPVGALAVVQDRS